MFFQLLNFCEIDKFAINSYCAIHNVGQELNLGDIAKVDIKTLPKKVTLITHGSPCTDFSIAGKQAGGDKGSGTASSLMWYSIDIIKYCKPKFVIWENVAHVLSNNHRHNFNAYIEKLDKLGYNSYYQIMNAKDYNVPQNRKRIFVISIKKSLDKGFVFPEKMSLKITLSDVLEKIDNGQFYYLTDEEINKMKHSKFRMARDRTQKKNYCDTLCASDTRRIKNIETDRGIRELTTLEYWRIMGFKDECHNKAAKVTDKKHLIKQAGNSICYNVIYLIMKELTTRYKRHFKNCTYISLFSGIGAFEMALSNC